MLTEHPGKERRLAAFLAIAAVISFVAPAQAETSEDDERPRLAGVWFSEQSFHHENVSADGLFATTEAPPPLPGDEPHLREPYVSAYREAQNSEPAGSGDFTLPADTEAQCHPDGMPKMMRGILPIEILQEPGKLVVLTEELSQVRRIFIGDPMPPLEELAQSYAGYSVGRWEGDTLVVDTAAILPQVNFIGLPNSGKVTVTERFRLAAPDRLEIAYTYSDPEVLAEPYQFTWTYERNDQHRILEYICDSNRYSAQPDGTLSFTIDPL